MAAQRVLSSTVLDDQDQNISYVGNRPWTVHTNQAATYELWGNGDTFTDEQYATATVKFYGSAIEYWGNQGRYHGPCQITLDGSVVGTISSNAAPDALPPILLYSINSLPVGDHTLKITVLSDVYPQVCEVDRFVVNVTTDVTYTSSYLYTGPGSQPTGAAVPTNGSGNGNGNGNGNSNGSNNSNTSNSSSGPPVAAIAGAVGGAAAIALLLVGWWLWRRSHRAKKEQKTGPPPTLRKNTGVSPFTGPSPSGAPTSPPAEAEKAPFLASGATQRPEFVHQTSSFTSGSPPPSSYGASTPAPSIGYNQYNYGPGVVRQASPGVHTISPPTSPGPIFRPDSVVSSAPTTTMSYYTSGAPTTEAAFPGGFVPQQHQQQLAPNIAPVWAAGSTATSPTMLTVSMPPAGPGPQVHSLPAGATYSAPAPVQPAPDEYPREKATYTARRDPVSAGESSSGKAALVTDTKAAPSSAAASSSQAGASSSGGGDIMAPAIPDAPPPAYQF